MSVASDRPLRQRGSFAPVGTRDVKEGNDNDNGTYESKGEDNDEINGENNGEGNGEGNGEELSVTSHQPL